MTSGACNGRVIARLKPQQLRRDLVPKTLNPLEAYEIVFVSNDHDFGDLVIANIYVKVIILVHVLLL